MLAVPIALKNLINVSVSAADTIMVGQLGEVQFSAVVAANQITFTYMVIAFGVAAGCGVLAAQYWGAGDREKVQDIFAFMHRIMAVVTLLFVTMALFFPQFVLGFIIDEPAVIAEGVRYLRIMGIAYLFFGFTTASLAMLRSAGVVKIAVILSLCSLMISVLLNFVLIFGHFGFPALGARGAAIATSTARVVEFVILLVYLFRVEKRVAFRPQHFLRKSRGIGRSFLKHSAPVLVNELVWVAANFMLMVIVGRMGQEFFAANGIAALLVQLVGVFSFGVSSAAATIIGNTIGMGEPEKAKRYANGLLLVSFLAGLLAFAVVQLVRLPLIQVYDISEEARIYARQITHIVSINVLLQSVALVSLLGILRGGGDTKFSAVVDAVTIWVIALPLGALAGFRWGLPLWLVYAILRSEDLFKAILVLWRVPSGKWLRDVTKG